jgi:hypothetical protein
MLNFQALVFGLPAAAVHVHHVDGLLHHAKVWQWQSVYTRMVEPPLLALELMPTI